MNVVKLWDASDQVGLQLQLVLGGLLFTQLAERHSLTALAMLPRSGHSLLAFFAALVVAVQRCLLTLLPLAIKW